MDFPGFVNRICATEISVDGFLSSWLETGETCTMRLYKLKFFPQKIAFKLRYLEIHQFNYYLLFCHSSVFRNIHTFVLTNRIFENYYERILALDRHLQKQTQLFDSRSDHPKVSSLQVEIVNSEINLKYLKLNFVSSTFLYLSVYKLLINTTVKLLDICV